MTEKGLRLKIRDALNALPRCKAMVRLPGETHYGHADIYGCCRGRHFELEVKLPGWRGPRRKGEQLQAHRLAEWREAGAIAEFVTSVEGALAAVKGERG